MRTSCVYWYLPQYFTPSLYDTAVTLWTSVRMLGNSIIAAGYFVKVFMVPLPNVNAEIVPLKFGPRARDPYYLVLHSPTHLLMLFYFVDKTFTRLNHNRLNYNRIGFSPFPLYTQMRKSECKNKKKTWFTTLKLTSSGIFSATVATCKCKICLSNL